MKRLLFILSLVGSVLCANAAPTPINERLQSADCRHWVDSVFSTLSLKERIGQLFVYTIAPQQDKQNLELLRKVVEDYKVGGLLFSGGKAHNQAVLTNRAQKMAEVPLLITFDGEWGVAMRLKEFPAFPKNMTLGCIQDNGLLYEYGCEVAHQMHEMGVQVNFAPVADVNINPKNPVINVRSFGADPGNVARKVVAYSKGLEENGILSVAKHFPGHGDTEVDSHKALPTLSFTRERLESTELYPFKEVIRAGLNGIMVGHLNVPALESKPNTPASLSRDIITDVLKKEMGFQGMVFTDALNMKGVGVSGTLCLRALQAGNDMLLVPSRIKEEVEAIHKAVKRGELSQEEINQKCRKVLAYKYALGLAKRSPIQLSGLEQRINTPELHDLIARLNRAAVTVLQNRAEVLPLDRVIKHVAVLHVGTAGRAKAFIEQMSVYANPVEFELPKNATAAQCADLKKKLAAYKRIVVCVSEERLSAYQNFFSDFRPKAPTVYAFFTTGKEMPRLQQAVSAADAVILGHSTADEVQKHVAQVLYGGATADGRLSASIGNLFATGAGVTIGPMTPPRFVPEEYGMNSDSLARIDSIAMEGIRKAAYPGCQVVILKNGKPIYDKAFGTHTGTGSTSVRPTDVYDLASLTKTSATLLAVMKLYETGKINLTTRLSEYLPFLQGTNKQNITVRDVLFHESGLPSTILFYLDAIDKESYKTTLFKSRKDQEHTVRIGSQTWGTPHFQFRKGLTSPTRTDSCTLQICDNLWLNAKFKKEYLQKIADAPLLSRRYRYSCVGFILLQQLVETRTGMGLDEYVAQEFYRPMGLKRTGYLPLRFLPKEEIIPSTNDSFLRKSKLQGFVHDESAAFQGGVSGNAGLFSTAEEVARIYQMLLNGGELDGKRYLSEKTCRTFTSTISRLSRRALGFDKPDMRNPKKSPCAPEAPASVFGHIGFTGTCAWVDPDNKLVYVFLSNRTYPHAWNSKLIKLNIRGRIQEAMYHALL